MLEGSIIQRMTFDMLNHYARVITSTEIKRFRPNFDSKLNLEFYTPARMKLIRADNCEFIIKNSAFLK